MQDQNAVGGPSRIPYKPRHPFVSAENRPERSDGVFRVLLISTGSVASIKIPDIVGALSKDAGIAVQVVATPPSLHFYSQETVDDAVRSGLGHNNDDEVMGEGSGQDIGVKVWKDADEWSDWKKVGDPILHIELRRWADLVVVVPCSADFLAKIAGGLSENLALSVLRALTPSTSVVLCPAMNTHMYQHPFTAKHLQIVQNELNYLILGPQGTGKLACGDDGPGKMTDWREIVSIIQDFAEMFRQNDFKIPTNATGRAAALTPQSNPSARPSTLRVPWSTPSSHDKSLPSTRTPATPVSDDFPPTMADFFVAKPGLPFTPGVAGQKGADTTRLQSVELRKVCSGTGTDSKVWKRWWYG